MAVVGVEIASWPALMIGGSFAALDDAKVGLRDQSFHVDQGSIIDYCRNESVNRIASDEGYIIIRAVSCSVG